MKNRFRIAHKPKFTDQMDIDTWHRLEIYLDKHGDAIFFDIVIRCSTHDHPSGGEGFVKYCIKNGWLVKVELDENMYTPWRAIEGNQVNNRYSAWKVIEGNQLAEDTDITWNQGI